MLTRLGFRATILHSVFNRRGGAVTVRAIVGTLGKNAFNTERSLKSFLKSSPLRKEKDLRAANLKVQTCAMIHTNKFFCLIHVVSMFF